MGDLEGSGFAGVGGGGLSSYGAVFQISWDTRGQEQLATAEGQMQRLTEAQRMHNQQLSGTTHVVASMTHSMLALGGVIMANSGATREQIKAYQTFHAVASALLTILVALRVAMMFVPGGQVAGAGGIRQAGMLMGMFMHQGGYGSDRMQVIQSGERVVPAHQVANNYGGNITIQNLNVSGGGGKELARDFTQQLESDIQRGVKPPAWP